MEPTRKELRELCVRLRQEGRWSYGMIQDALGVPKSTLRTWLQQYPLREEEKQALNRIMCRNKADDEPSKYYLLAQNETLSTDRKGEIAECAIMLRLCLHGLSPFKNIFDNDKADLVVRSFNGGLVKIQVKWAYTPHYGKPMIAVTKNYNKTYDDGDIDFLVGYYLYSDIAYVFPWDLIREYKRNIKLVEKYKERWDLIKGF